MVGPILRVIKVQKNLPGQCRILTQFSCPLTSCGQKLRMTNSNNFESLVHPSQDILTYQGMLSTYLRNFAVKFMQKIVRTVTKQVKCWLAGRYFSTERERFLARKGSIFFALTQIIAKAMQRLGTESRKLHFSHSTKSGANFWCKILSQFFMIHILMLLMKIFDKCVRYLPTQHQQQQQQGFKPGHHQIKKFSPINRYKQPSISLFFRHRPESVVDREDNVESFGSSKGQFRLDKAVCV